MNIGSDSENKPFAINADLGALLAYVKDQLGHSSIKITVDVYGHLVPGANRQEMNRLPGMRQGSRNAPKSKKAG